MKSHCRWLGVLVFLSLWPVSALAQDAAPPAALLAQRLSEEVRSRVLKGRALLDNNDDLAVATLRDAAQSALPSLEQVAGKNALGAAPESLPRDVVTANLAYNAAEAHYYWGVAADRFARRDESITALARAARLSRASAAAPLDGGLLRRDTADALKRVLKDGLPLIAPDDVLDSIALFAHGGLWKPSRNAFDPAPLSGEIGGGALSKEEFLITDGSLFPPLAPTANPLVRVPSYYQEVPFENLPDALKLNKMVAGYTRQNSGPNKAQWRQIVRVFYASPYLTKDRRDDLPRARALCEQFLRVHALFREQLGAANQFARGDKTEGVTTLWLLEVSALWPQDDEDPSVLAQLGPRMPGLNTGKQREPSDPETTALMRPWMPVAGQSEGEPGEILFWKAGLARPEAEWVREVCHEYGHVALPPLGGFRPPLEPFGNGVMGETLGLLWAAQLPSRFGAAPSGKGAGEAMLGDFSNHVKTQALPALGFFRKAGPESPLRASSTREGWTYLQGLTTYLERVYGGHMLGRALAPLSQRAANVTSIAARRSLMDTQTLLNSVDVTWRDPWNGRKTLAVWLPGALNLPLSAPQLISRGEAALKARTRAQVLLWVPSGADSLRIEGAGAQNLRAIGLPFQAAQGGMRVYFAGKSGWQTFSLLAGADAKISAARFERK